MHIHILKVVRWHVWHSGSVQQMLMLVNGDGRPVDDPEPVMGMSFLTGLILVSRALVWVGKTRRVCVPIANPSHDADHSASLPCGLAEPLAAQPGRIDSRLSLPALLHFL